VAGPLTPKGTPPRPGRRERFDSIVLDVVRSLENRWADELAQVELAVEEAPVVAADWRGDTVPLASVVRHGAGVRLVVFRRPIELRAATESDLAALVLTVVVEQVSELLGRPPHEIDPRYEE
jgi:predicted Zn-dependent protease with MMP-like domain